MQIECLVIIMLICGINAFNNFADVNCGHKPTRREGKIVGGTTADKGEFPWLVSITRRGGHFCGGTLISNRFILTAGHCLCTGIGTDTVKPTHIKVTIAQHDLTNKSSDAYEMTLKAISIHPDYTCGKVKDDIAILELDNKLVWSDSVSPACLAASSHEDDYKPIDNLPAVVAGWGWTNEDSSKGGRAKVLQKAKVNVIETEKCRQWFQSQGKKTKIQNTQICAGHEQGGIDACWADSGGPLMIETGTVDQMMVVGVVSTGIGCARPFLPGLYTRISEYIPWVREIVNK
ncbi:trypsin-1-like [Tribolium madens]|uniref:trypsin-1-like n=1 Tax=Tribolium madens TaxID=41895 RepID=UPI001CF7303E|nr:trypsin-1-like [Tribolium madens]